MSLDVYEEVDTPKDAKPIKMVWVNTHKKNELNEAESRRAAVNKDFDFDVGTTLVPTAS